MSTLLPLLLALFQSVEGLQPNGAYFPDHWAEHVQNHAVASSSVLETAVVHRDRTLSAALAAVFNTTEANNGQTGIAGNVSDSPVASPNNSYFDAENGYREGLKMETRESEETLKPEGCDNLSAAVSPNAPVRRERKS